MKLSKEEPKKKTKPKTGVKPKTTAPKARLPKITVPNGKKN